jgi:hypothetical protein
MRQTAQYKTPKTRTPMPTTQYLCQFKGGLPAYDHQDTYNQYGNGGVSPTPLAGLRNGATITTYKIQNIIEHAQHNGKHLLTKHSGSEKENCQRKPH